MRKDPINKNEMIIDMTIKAIMLCKLGISVIKPVIEELKNIPQITKVMSLTGDYDALAEIINYAISQNVGLVPFEDAMNELEYLSK